MAKRKWSYYLGPNRIRKRYLRMSKKKKASLHWQILALFLVVALLFLSRTWSADWPKQPVPNEATPNESEAAFVERIGRLAQANYAQSQILPSLVTAQAILESDFGRSDLAQDYHNLFGRKAYGNEPSALFPTQEVVDGQTITVQAPFKVYPNDQAAIEDHAELMHNGVNWDPGLYHDVIGEKDYRKASQALQAAGYATDPTYDQKLNQIIENYQLTRFDSLTEERNE